MNIQKNSKKQIIVIKQYTKKRKFFKKRIYRGQKEIITQFPFEKRRKKKSRFSFVTDVWKTGIEFSMVDYFFVEWTLPFERLKTG